MEKESRILKSLFWSVMIGGSLGIIESAICIRLWLAFGSPYFLIKPNHIDDAGFLTITLISGGIIVGLIFGIIVGVITLKRQMNVRFIPLYLSIILLGAITYALMYTLTLTFRIFPFSMACDPFLFLAGLRLARIFSLEIAPL